MSEERLCTFWYQKDWEGIQRYLESVKENERFLLWGPPKYWTSYKGLYYKYIPENDRWRISEDLFELAHVWIFNASILRLDQCFEKIDQDADYQYYLKNIKNGK